MVSPPPPPPTDLLLNPCQARPRRPRPGWRPAAGRVQRWRVQWMTVQGAGAAAEAAGAAGHEEGARAPLCDLSSYLYP